MQFLFRKMLALLGLTSLLVGCQSTSTPDGKAPTLILHNGRIATMAAPDSFVQAIAIRDGLVQQIGTSEAILALKGDSTQVVDLGGRTVIPGLNDSHLHIIREGLNYTIELRWDGVRSLKRALAMLKEQAARTPEGAWIKVVGGWNEFQFAERRLPTLAEINESVPDKPVFLLYLYGLGMVNQKGIEVLGYDKNTKYTDGVVELDKTGKPTGLLIAKPNAMILYTTLGKTNKLSRTDQLISTQHYYRELNRLGLTSAIDAGGGGQNFPDDYSVSIELAKQGKLTVRTAYYLFAQKKGTELKDYERWVAMAKPNNNDHLFYRNGYTTEGAGENLVWSAADFENFLEPRPDLDPHMEQELRPVLDLLVKNRWPFRLHATYGESIDRDLAVIEAVNQATPLNGLRWFFDHAETVTDSQLARIKALGGGIAIQDRMFFQGEHFVKRYGAEAAAQAPPIRKMLAAGIPVGLGTDGTRVSSYNPWFSLYWITTGRTFGGLQIYPQDQILNRYEALQLMTTGSAWFSGEETVKGTLVPGQYADLAVLADDYWTVPSERLLTMTSVLTVVNGQVVYGADGFASLNPPLPEIAPAWSPVKFYGGIQTK